MELGDGTEATWRYRFTELVAWKEEYGDCAVPKSAGVLGRWTSRQRCVADTVRSSTDYLPV